MQVGLPGDTSSCAGLVYEPPRNQRQRVAGLYASDIAFVNTELMGSLEVRFASTAASHAGKLIRRGEMLEVNRLVHDNLNRMALLERGDVCFVL